MPTFTVRPQGMVIFVYDVEDEQAARERVGEMFDVESEEFKTPPDIYIAGVGTMKVEEGEVY